MSRLVVFTDLDGTLLAHEDYDWAPARPALAALADRGVPLVIASSKTRAEIEAWRRRLDNHDPFISENGGALFVPPGSTPRPPADARNAGGYLCVEFGTPYPALRAALRQIARAAGVGLRGFGDMDPAEIGERTGLSGADLELAREREYDEPFVPARELDGESELRLLGAAAALGLTITRGGRFHHLIGANDKGRAAQALVRAYRSGGDEVVTLALGDGANDLELLAAVDWPIVVARPGGSHAAALREGVPHARFTRAPGPEGFAEAVLEFLGRPR